MVYYKTQEIKKSLMKLIKNINQIINENKKIKKEIKQLLEQIKAKFNIYNFSS